MLKIDKCKNCHHFMSFEGLPSLFNASNTGMCRQGGKNYKDWRIQAPTDSCVSFKDKAGVKIIENAKTAQPTDILKSTDVEGKCEDCDSWSAAEGKMSTYCPEVLQFVNATAYCPKYKESSKRRILKPQPVEIVKPAICKNCDQIKGDLTENVVWCNRKAGAVDANHYCKDYKEAVPINLPPIPIPTPIQPKDEIGPGDKFEAVVGQQMTLLWVGEHLVIGRDAEGQEHGFEKKKMRFQKC